MFKWLLGTDTQKEQERSRKERRERKATEGVYKEPPKASFTDPEFAKQVDTIVDSLKMPVSRRVPDFTLLEPAVLRSEDKFRQMGYKKALMDFMECYRKGWFSVCLIASVEESFGVSRSSSYRLREIHERLRLIHCMHWENMDVEVIDEIPSMLNESFRIIEQLAYPDMQNEYEGEFTRSYDSNSSEQNVYYIENGMLKNREA